MPRASNFLFLSSIFHFSSTFFFHSHFGFSSHSASFLHYLCYSVYPPFFSAFLFFFLPISQASVNSRLFHLFSLFLFFLIYFSFIRLPFYSYSPQFSPSILTFILFHYVLLVFISLPLCLLFLPSLSPSLPLLFLFSLFIFHPFLTFFF